MIAASIMMSRILTEEELGPKRYDERKKETNKKMANSQLQQVEKGSKVKESKKCSTASGESRTKWTICLFFLCCKQFHQVPLQ